MNKLELIKHLQKLGIKTQKNKIAKKDIFSALKKIVSAEDPKNSKVVKNFQKGYNYFKISKVTYIPPSGDFEAHSKAAEELKNKGYVVGSMARDEPIGFAPEKEYTRVVKWYNLEREDKMKLHGVLLSEDFREGGVYTMWFVLPKEIAKK